MKPKTLNRVDITHRRPLEPGVVWLIDNGYRLKMVERRVYLERVVAPAARLVT